MLLKRKSFVFLLLLCCFYAVSQQANRTKTDSALFYIEKSKDNSIAATERIVYAKKAKHLADKIKNDSLYNQALKHIALNLYFDKNYNLFKKASQEYLEHAHKIKDSNAIANANSYLGEFYSIASKSDSAYFYLYTSEKIYEELKDDFNRARMLLRIAIIQKNEKDFIGSEVTSIEGISLLKPIGDKSVISGFYNNLGIIYNELGDYNQAISYYEKYIALQKEINSDAYKNGRVYNNLAYAYKDMGDYNKALNYFELILKGDLKAKDPGYYGMVMDNYAHAKFLKGDFDDLPELYFEALKFCKSSDNEYNTIAINIHLSEYYNETNKLDSARYYGRKAKNIAKKFHNDDYLKALLNLSKIETDSLAVQYYQEYIALSDSLIDGERKIRNKFARIRYETKEIEERNAKITKERLYLTILSIGLVLTMLLAYIAISQRAKNKELQLNQLQQEANEEIYNLMLTQQEKVKEGRVQEKKRISEELHDGILGRLFGTRLSLDSLNNNTSQEAAKNRNQYIEELKSIEEEIRKISHDLNTDFISGSGFYEMVETLVQNQTKAYNLNYKLKNDTGINWDQVPNKTKINLYRIVQESMQNIYKHADAKQVIIKFKLDEGIIRLTIQDDGKGFDVDKAKRGIGLKNMRSRVKELDGELTVQSEKNKGTLLEIEVTH